jgi:hypothetical protein
MVAVECKIPPSHEKFFSPEQFTKKVHGSDRWGVACPTSGNSTFPATSEAALCKQSLEKRLVSSVWSASDLCFIACG